MEAVDLGCLLHRCSVAVAWDQHGVLPVNDVHNKARVSSIVNDL